MKADVGLVARSHSNLSGRTQVNDMQGFCKEFQASFVNFIPIKKNIYSMSYLAPKFRRQRPVLGRSFGAQERKGEIKNDCGRSLSALE